MALVYEVAMPSRQMLALVVLGVLSSCALIGNSGTDHKALEAGFIERLGLAEVSFILTKDQILAGELGFGRIKDLYPAVSGEGVTDVEIEAGQVIAIRGGLVWANTISGKTHNRLSIALLPKGLSVAPGNVVEVRYSGSGHLPKVERVRAQDRNDGHCAYVEVLDPFPVQVLKDVVGLLSLIGPPELHRFTVRESKARVGGLKVGHGLKSCQHQ